jgi:hypothetical protein
MPEGIDGWIVHRTHTSFLSLLSTASISFPYLFVAPLSCPYPIAATWPTRCLHLSLPRCHDRQIARPTFLHFSHFLVFCTIIPFAVSFQKNGPLAQRRRHWYLGSVCRRQFFWRAYVRLRATVELTWRVPRRQDLRR